MSSSTDVTFAPANPFIQLDLFQEVSWRAVSAGKPVRLVYAARNSHATDQRLAREQSDYDAGRLDPERLYVLFPEAKIPRGAENRLIVLDNVRLLVPKPKVSARSVPS